MTEPKALAIKEGDAYLFLISSSLAQTAATLTLTAQIRGEKLSPAAAMKLAEDYASDSLKHAKALFESLQESALDNPAPQS